jgi:hypothetical protein
MALCYTLWESGVVYDCWFTGNQFVVAPSPCRLATISPFLQLNSCDHSPFVTSSLRGKWICLYEFAWPLSSAFMAYVARCRKFCVLNCVQALCQPRLRKDHVYLAHLRLQRQLNDLEGRTLDRRQVQASYIFYIYINMRLKSVSFGSGLSAPISWRFRV